MNMVVMIMIMIIIVSYCWCWATLTTSRSWKPRLWGWRRRSWPPWGRSWRRTRSRRVSRGTAPRSGTAPWAYLQGRGTGYGLIAFIQFWEKFVFYSFQDSSISHLYGDKRNLIKEIIKVISVSFSPNQLASSWHWLSLIGQLHKMFIFHISICFWRSIC